MTRVIARLHGGLGNQLFQYAVGRAVALRTGSELLLDARPLADGTKGRYHLGHFAIQARVANESELPPAKSRPLAYAWWRKFGRSPRFVREQGLGYNERIETVGPKLRAMFSWNKDGVKDADEANSFTGKIARAQVQ